MIKEHHISQVEKKVKQPEVGDVWQPKNNEYSRVIVTYYNDEFDVLLIAIRYAGILQKIKKYHKKWFVKNYTYLGKSKVSIKELFDVAED